MKTEKDSKSLEYEITLVWDTKSGGRAFIRDFRPLEFDMPTEFGGGSRFPCPDEHLFSAVGGCLLTTFLYFRKRLRLSLRDLRVSVRGTVDSVGPKGYRITGIEASIAVEVDAREKSKAEKCAELTKDYCHIARSVEAGFPVKVLPNVITS